MSTYHGTRHAGRLEHTPDLSSTASSASLGDDAVAAPPADLLAEEGPSESLKSGTSSNSAWHATGRRDGTKRPQTCLCDIRRQHAGPLVGVVALKDRILCGALESCLHSTRSRFAASSQAKQPHSLLQATPVSMERKASDNFLRRAGYVNLRRHACAPEHSTTRVAFQSASAAGLPAFEKQRMTSSHFTSKPSIYVPVAFARSSVPGGQGLKQACRPRVLARVAAPVLTAVRVVDSRNRCNSLLLCFLSTCRCSRNTTQVFARLASRPR